MQLTHEWQEYDGDYEKSMYDVRTKDGKEYLRCWPNDNRFYNLNDDELPSIPNEEVTYVRMSAEWMTEEEEEAALVKPKMDIATIGIGELGRGQILKDLIMLNALEHSKNIIVVDESNLSSISAGIKEKGLAINKIIEKERLIPYTVTEGFIPKITGTTPNFKENKGLNLGSYKSKKKNK